MGAAELALQCQLGMHLLKKLLCIFTQIQPFDFLKWKTYIETSTAPKNARKNQNIKISVVWRGSNSIKDWQGD